MCIAHQPRRPEKSSWLAPFSNVKIQELQHQDPDLAPVVEWKKSGVRPLSSETQRMAPATRHYWLYWDSLELIDGVLCRRFTKKDNSGSYLQLMVPRGIRDEVLRQMHDALLSGHLGQKKTRAKVLQRFYWFGVRGEVNLWVVRCDTCAVTKPTLDKKMVSYQLEALWIG